MRLTKMIEAVPNRIVEVSITDLVYTKEDSTFSAEASSIGIRAGDIPDVIRVNGKDNTIDFDHYSNQANGGEVGAFEYHSPKGIYKLIIFND